MLQARQWQREADQVLAQARKDGLWLPEACAEKDQLSTLLEQPGAQLLLLPQAKELRDELSRLRLLQEVQQMLPGEPPLEAVRATLDEAHALTVEHLPPVIELQKRYTAASKWAQRANIALRRRTGLAALEALQQEVSGFAMTVEQQTEVEERIASAQDWSSRARKALEGMANVDVVRTLLEEAQRLDVTVPEEETIATMVKSVDWWTKRASNTFLKRGCNITLLEVLLADGEQLLDESAPGSGSTGAAGLACLYCTGNDTATLNRFMIGCDKCGRWYHGPCVGVGKNAADAMDEFLCPECSRREGVPYAFAPPTPVPKFTRRPRLRYVTSLLAEAAEIGVDMPEAALISKLQQTAEGWQTQAQDLLDMGDDATLNPTAIDELVCAGDACEVEPEALPQLRKLRSQLSSWQQKVLSVLNGELEVDAPLLEEEAEIEQELAENALRGASQKGSASVGLEGSPHVEGRDSAEGALKRLCASADEANDASHGRGGVSLKETSERPSSAEPPGEQALSPAAQRRSASAEELLVSDVPWLSRDHMRAILRKEAVPCKASKAEMQAQASPHRQYG
mgnify:CR=1 FL=1